jgi:hypothetical protein
MTQQSVKSMAEKFSASKRTLYFEAFSKVIEHLSRTEAFLREHLAVLTIR